MNNILELSNISVSFGENQVLNNISLKINKGDIVSLIGKNGTGKSTLLKTIVGINKNYSGKIIKNYNSVGYVPQKINIDPTVPLTVSEFFNIYSKKNILKLEKLLHIFQSNDLITKQVSKLSGGELQKILIINSLLCEPDFLILDEPTAGIDTIGEEIFYEMINTIHLQFPDLAILIVSHNMKMVYSHSTYIICLHKSCYCTGTPEELKNNENFSNLFGEFVIPYKHTHDHTHNHD